MSKHSGMFVRRDVVWARSAEVELGEIWRRARDRGAVVNAADDIDYILKDYAHTKLFEPEAAEGFKSFKWRPLCILFEILEDEGLVRILAVKRVD